MTAIDTRNLKRDSLFLMADVRLEGSLRSERVKVRNLSDGGIMVEGELIASPGQRVVVTLKKIGKVGGVVAWIQSARVGISFDEPVDASLARTSLAGKMPEAPRYVRPAMAPRTHIWSVRKL